MSGLPALSIELPAIDLADQPQRGPRVADAIDPPVSSPVHDLQDQLQRFNTVDARTQLPAKMPGWLRLAAPLGLSIFLWGSILWAMGL